ncbi:MAG: ABC transporter ATP-binding protein [bacterium]|nr:ABC transporter ATP-binding protein [bacterium]
MHRPRTTLWSVTHGQRLRYAGAIASLAVAITCLFVPPLVVRSAIDGPLAGGDAGWLGATARRLFATDSVAGTLWTAALLILLLTALAGFFQYVKGRHAALASERAVRRMRDSLFDHLAHVSCDRIVSLETGDLVQRCTSDVDTVRAFLSVQVVEIGRCVLLFVIALPILIGLSPSMTLISVVLVPFVFSFAWIFFRKVQALFREVDEAEGAMTATLQENLTGIRVVRAFARADFESEKFGACNAAYRDTNFRWIRTLGVYWSVSDILVLSQMGLVLFGGAHAVAAGTLTLGTWVAFMTYMTLFIHPVRQLGRVLAEAGRALVALGRIGEIFGLPREDRREKELDAHALESGLTRIHPLPDRVAGRLDFDAVRFAFPAGPDVLDGLTFTIEPGETVALVGAPGSGKSTLVALLLRLYELERGLIRLDGRPLQSLPRAFVRAQIGAVMQEPFLYSKTVAENLRVGRHGADAHELESATRDASLHHTIDGFVHGYETLVGERGVTLSGGQRQRVALARALLKDPAVLVLDDALSAVDTGTESRILEALERRHRRRTTLVIAHRLSTLRHADRIIVLEHGRIAEIGPHAELISGAGLYARLWKIQSELEDDLSTDLALAPNEPWNPQAKATAKETP